MNRNVFQSSRKGFTLIELLVVIAIIAVLIGLLVPAVQKVREAANKMTCSNNMKQMGLAALNHESQLGHLPSSGQLGSTGSNTTTYMVHSFGTQILPYIEQEQVYKQFDHSSVPGTDWTVATGVLLHQLARGRDYDDPAFPTGWTAAQTKVSTFVCPSTPIPVLTRSGGEGLGVVDYMVPESSDVDEGTGERVTSSPTASYRGRFLGILGDARPTMAMALDGSSNCIMIIEDASRAHPAVATFGSGSSRNSPVAAPGHPVVGDGLASNARRVYAWADPDAFANGFSGPHRSTSGDKKAKVNNHSMPVGGPAGCRWNVNNCGPNDEPFSFHTGGVNAVMGDGSVRFIKDTVSGIFIKNAIGTQDGQVTNLD